MSPREKSSPNIPSWAGLVVVSLLAILFGVTVLPRFGRGLEGKPAPDFSLPVISGGEPDARVRLSEQRGKLVLLDFWASWCVPCRAQTEVISRVSRRPEISGLVVVGINVSDAPEAARRYLAAVKPSWVVVEDADDQANRAYGVDALPTLVVIDRAGRVFAVRRHFVDDRELSALLTALQSSSSVFAAQRLSPQPDSTEL